MVSNRSSQQKRIKTGRTSVETPDKVIDIQGERRGGSGRGGNRNEWIAFRPSGLSLGKTRKQRNIKTKEHNLPTDYTRPQRVILEERDTGGNDKGKNNTKIAVVNKQWIKRGRVNLR